MSRSDNETGRVVVLVDGARGYFHESKILEIMEGLLESLLAERKTLWAVMVRGYTGTDHTVTEWAKSRNVHVFSFHEGSPDRSVRSLEETDMKTRDMEMIEMGTSIGHEFRVLEMPELDIAFSWVIDHVKAFNEKGEGPEIRYDEYTAYLSEV